ncbi:MAG: hypothetical protein WBZ36_09425 [Candidatus Nitrosopolaris sp.]
MAEEDHLTAFLSKHQNEIIDWVNKNTKTQFTPTGNMFDRLANQVNQEYPYGENIDNAHRFLTTAIMSSLWCGWFSQARTNAGDVNFKPEYIEKFGEIINKAFSIGVEFAAVKQ